MTPLHFWRVTGWSSCSSEPGSTWRVQNAQQSPRQFGNIVVPLFGSAVLRKRTTSYSLCDLIRLLQETPGDEDIIQGIAGIRTSLKHGQCFLRLGFLYVTFWNICRCDCLLPLSSSNNLTMALLLVCGLWQPRGMDLVRIAISVGKPKNLTNSLVVGLFHRCLQLFNFHIREIQMIGEPCYFDAWPSDDSLNLFESSWILSLCIRYTYIYVYINVTWLLGVIISPGKVVEKMEWS